MLRDGPVAQHDPVLAQALNAPAFELLLVKPGVQATSPDQLVVGALFHDLAVVDAEYDVRR